MLRILALLALVVFLAPAGADDAAERARLRDLVRRGVPGAAWFRHRLAKLGAEAPDARPRDRETAFDRSIGMVTGGRAVAENLALDRDLVDVIPGEAATVPLPEIRGVTVRPLELEAPGDVAVDPLAAFVPADQHAVFFPDFGALADVLDEAERLGTSPLRWVEERCVDALTRERYERRLGVRATTRRDRPVRQVAITSSDLYLRTGSDLAVLVASEEPVPDFEALADGVWFRTLSPAQAAKLRAAAAGEMPVLARTDEYRFFRDRYGIDEPETAFAVLPDAALRRWCGPKWRIGASRRTRAQALLAEARAAEIAGDEPPEGIDEVRRVYGELTWLTPIADLEFEKVTPSEAAAYRRWRGGYETTWSRYYDPIGARLVLDGGRIELDLSVFPLRDDSDYEDLIELVGEAGISSFGGDPHPEALIHLMLAVDRRSEPMRELGELSLPLTGEAGINLLDWVGDELAIWVDEAPEVLAFAKDTEGTFQQGMERFPLGLRVTIRNPFGLAAFLTGIRTSMLAGAPGVIQFATREHAGLKYVFLSPGPNYQVDGPGIREACYASFGGALLLTFSEETMRRAIDRHVARKAAEDPPPPADAPWPGKSLAIRATAAAAPLLDGLFGESWDERMARRAADAEPILDEWRRLYPDEDPVQVHERLFGERITDPRKLSRPWRAWESAAFGLTFERGGLRARATLRRR